MLFIVAMSVYSMAAGVGIEGQYRQIESLQARLECSLHYTDFAQDEMRTQAAEIAHLRSLVKADDHEFWQTVLEKLDASTCDANGAGCASGGSLPRTSAAKWRWR
jgi:hypothetical protein